MPIVYKTGDLFKSDEKVLAHGCNCVGGFGSGIAKLMDMNYPETKKHYYKKFYGEGWKLGDIQIVEIPNQKYVINCATQYKYAPRNVCHADYPAIKETMEKVYHFVKQNNYTVAIPKIGAGLAGGDWTIIEKIINEVFVDYDIVVYVYDK